MIHSLLELASLLQLRGIGAYFQNERQLVVSRQSGPAFPNAGNSFWVSRLSGMWYVCTWSPRYYRVGEQATLVDVVEAFLDVGGSAQPRMPAAIVEQFGLTEIESDAFERCWENDLPGAQGNVQA